MPLNPPDLRVGNVVQLDGKPVVIGHATVIDTAMIRGEGVQLTPDILLKAGFAEKNGAYKRHNFTITRLDESGKIFRIMYAEVYIMDYSFYHQLQNLVYFMTGEELTINL